MSLLRKRFLIRTLAASLAMLILLGGCAISDRTRRNLVAEIASHLPPPQRPLVIVPGFGQSRLWNPETSEFVWGTAHSTIVRGYEEDLDLPLVSTALEMPMDALEPNGYTGKWGPVDFAWNLAKPLVSHGGYSLEPGLRSVYFFEYDWRLGTDHNAKRLDAYLDEIRLDLGQPTLRFDVLGHSLGAMVVTTWLAMGDSGVDQPELWEEGSRRAREKTEKVVLIANPSAGVTESIRFLARGEKFLRREIDPATVATFPVIYELLPDEDDLFVRWDRRVVRAAPGSDRFWEILGIGTDDPEIRRSRQILLQRGREIRKAQRMYPPDASRLVQIGGDCVPTPRRVFIRENGTLLFAADELDPVELQRMSGLVFVPGDGSVSRQNAVQFESERVILCDGHHALTSDPDVHRTLLRTFVESRPAGPGSVSAVAAAGN
ncbi:MAG: hypothetical protein KY459_00420 [Acidobacteria bacterium]|nr:hypothetical protein [Acidobacteriota bacterium]